MPYAQRRKCAKVFGNARLVKSLILRAFSRHARASICIAPRNLNRTRSSRLYILPKTPRAARVRHTMLLCKSARFISNHLYAQRWKEQCVFAWKLSWRKENYSKEKTPAFVCGGTESLSVYYAINTILEYPRHISLSYTHVNSHTVIGLFDVTLENMQIGRLLFTKCSRGAVITM